VHGSSVHCSRMRNITLSADEHLIEQARDVAQASRTTLNQAFRDWLQSYAHPDSGAAGFDSMMARLSYARGGRKFTRDEMNER
jgi:hypothetical protein